MRKKATISHCLKARIPRSTLYWILKSMLYMANQLSFRNPIDHRKFPMDKLDH